MTVENQVHNVEWLPENSYRAAVVGTITRGVRVTEHIKTGQRIRIDGTNGVVEVIKS